MVRMVSEGKRENQEENEWILVRSRKRNGMGSFARDQGTNLKFPSKGTGTDRFL